MSRFPRLFAICMTIVLAGTATFISGCRGPAAPDPSMTAVRSGQGDGTGADGDWIRSQGFGTGDELGLAGRDGRMNAANDNRITGLYPSVYFEFDQSFIRPEDRGILQQVADYMSSNSTTTLLIEGHCDWRGTTEYNLALGERRAQSVKGYLEQLSIAGTRIEILSKGDLDSTTEANESQMQQDRRADFVFFP